VNLRDGGPDSCAVLPLSLPGVAVSLCCEFLGLAVVIRARHRSSRWARCPALESYQSRRQFASGARQKCRAFWIMAGQSQVLRCGTTLRSWPSLWTS
jgi:hypothetical protein